MLLRQIVTSHCCVNFSRASFLYALQGALRGLYTALHAAPSACHVLLITDDGQLPQADTTILQHLLAMATEKRLKVTAELN